MSPPPEPSPTVARPTRVGAFDGLRGLAVLVVVLFHAQFSWARGGFLGVSAFFTLSGFLITSLLLDEHARDGRISLRTFWTRRARRLFPAAWLALGAVLVYGATVASVDQVRALRGDVLSALFDVANWHFYFAGRSYEQLFTAPSPVLHFWSLAIEEQFYLVFPLLLVAGLWLVRGRRALLGGLIGVGAFASLVAGWHFADTVGQSRVYYGADTRASELLVGALLAVLCTRGTAHAPTRAHVTPRGRVVAAVAGGAALLVMAFWWTTVDQSSKWLYHGGFTIHALLVAVVIAAARIDSPLARGLAWRPLVWLGALSYGIYLFHWPIFLWLSPERTGLATAPLFALRVGVTLICAVASYRLLEQPVLRGERVRGKRALVLAPACAAALVVVLVATTSSVPQPQIVLSTLAQTTPAAPVDVTSTTPTTVAPPRTMTATKSRVARLVNLARPVGGTRPLRVMVVGDSVGLTFGRGIELWARQHGAIAENLGQTYCPLGRGMPIQAGFNENDSPQGCDWTSRWESTIADFDPDVTLVLFTIWEAAARKLPGSDAWRAPGDPALDDWQVSEYEAAADTLTARGGHVVWLTAPCGKDFTPDKAEGLWYVDHRTIPRVARARKHVHVLDLDVETCPHGAFTDVIDGVPGARPDGVHFSDAGALAVANWAMPIVLGLAPPPADPRSPHRRER